MSAASIFDEQYPNISWWVTEIGWIELGEDHMSASMIRILNEGGMHWESDETYPTVAEALAAADAFIAQWRADHID